MATLDDKLMGEKLHYYCSSSEDESNEPPQQTASTTTSRQKSSFRRLKQLPSTNTGPKGK